MRTSGSRASSGRALPLLDHTLSRRNLLGGLGLGAVAALAACGSSDTPTAGGKTPLKVYGWKGGGSEPANIAQVNAAFQQANPDIELTFEYVPPNDPYTQRVQPELLAGKSADVIMTDSSKVQDWGSAGYLEDLGSGSWTANVLPALKPFISQNSTIYAVPMEIIGIDLYANTDLLAKAGVSAVPTTFPAFLAALGAAKKAGITPLGMPNKNGWTGAAALNAIAATKVYQATPDWDTKFLAGQASFADWQSSVDQLLQLQTAGFVDYRKELGVDEWTQGLADFTSGKSAFWFQGAWNLSAVEKAGVKSVFVPWPGADEGAQPSANLFVGTMWSIHAESKVKDAAKKYVEFWASSTNAAPYLTAENAVSPFQGGTTPSSDATADFVKSFSANRYRILPSNTWSGAEGEKTMQQQVQALMLGQTSAADMLKGFDKSLRKS